MVKRLATNARSSLVGGFWACCFFSDFFPSTTILHKLQGCLPSKVLSSASFKVADCEKLTAMPTHATDCRIAQCRPSEHESVITRRNFETLRSMAQPYYFNRVSSRGPVSGCQGKQFSFWLS